MNNLLLNKLEANLYDDFNNEIKRASVLLKTSPTTQAINVLYLTNMKKYNEATEELLKSRQIHPVPVQFIKVQQQSVSHLSLGLHTVGSKDE